MTAQCARCGKPMPDTGPICHRPCASELAEALRTAAGHAEDAEAVLARQTRYGAGSRGGSGEPLPVDLTAADRYRAIENTIATWARDIEDTTGDRVPPPVWPALNSTHAAALFLAAHTEDLRKHPAAAEAFDDLHTTCTALARLVDRPADKDLVGMCDCGKVLYATRGSQMIRCPMPTCRLNWNVAESRDILRNALRGKLFTAAEAAHFAAHWDERTTEQIRKLVNAWSSRGHLAAHGAIGGDPAYRFGDILDRLARTPRRERRTREAAEIGA